MINVYAQKHVEVQMYYMSWFLIKLNVTEKMFHKLIPLYT